MGAQALRKLEFAEPPILVDWRLEFTRPQNRKAHAYWNSLRGDRQMPSRRELSPRGMREFLTHVNLVDVCPESEGAVDYKVTLQGSNGLDLLGHLAHRRLDTCLSEVTARRLRECLDHAKDSARPVRISSGVTGGDKRWLEAECLFAPLGDEDGRVSSIFWVLVTWHPTAPQ
jgi:hypothetical protein